MDNNLLWYIINTLESLTIVSTEDNLSKLLAVVSTLKKLAKAQEESEQGGETNG